MARSIMKQPTTHYAPPNKRTRYKTIAGPAKALEPVTNFQERQRNMFTCTLNIPSAQNLDHEKPTGEQLQVLWQVNYKEKKEMEGEEIQITEGIFKQISGFC